MTNPSCATTKKTLIEKFSGKFNKEPGGCTIQVNKTIQSIRDLTTLGIYSYLTTQPPEWEISATQLSVHFGIGINKTRRSLTELVNQGLLIRYEIKEKGKFIKYVHKLLIKPLHGYREAENRETATVRRKRCTNKTITSLENKEEKKDAHALSNPKPKNPSIQEHQDYRWFLKNQPLSMPKDLEWIKEWLKEHD